MKIALDAMGGDLAPQAAIQGAINTLKKTKDKIHIIIVGDENQIKFELGDSIPDHISIHHTTQIVTMNDTGSKVLKRKPDSSIVQGINLVKDLKESLFQRL